MRKIHFWQSKSFSLVRLSTIFTALLLMFNALSGQTVPPVQKSCSVQGSVRAVNLTVKGAIPERARVNAVPVQRTAAQGKQVKGAYDITITDGSAQWQPGVGEPVMVTIYDNAFVDGELLDIYHEDANGQEFVGTVAASNHTIVFPAFAFSVYIVTEAGEDARLRVNFHLNATDTVSLYVKPSDIGSHFNSIVYDPGVGALPSGVQFRGWTTNASYTANDIANGMTIDGVRTDIQDRLTPASSFVASTVDYYAMLFRSYQVIYLDDRLATLGVHDVSFRADANTSSLSYVVSMGYTVPDANHSFQGWQVNDGGNNISGWTPGTTYTNGTTITISGNVTFGVRAPEGHWLVFDENGKGATYNAPMFVENAATTVCPVLAQPENMLRNGYTFEGWYTDAACTDGNEFTFGNILEDRVTIYAKWEPKTIAEYSIIIWKQNLEGNGYDFEELVTLQGNVGSNISTVTATGSGNSRYARVNGVNKQYTGFHLDRYDSDMTIVPEGNAELNVYYHRNQHTLTFRDLVDTYTVTTNNNGTQYGLVDGEYIEIERKNGNWRFTYSGTRYTQNGNTYTATTSTSNNPPQYGLVNGEYVQLTRTGGGWFSPNYTWYAPYTGTRYTHSNALSPIKTITALAGQNIGSHFPIEGTNNVTYNHGERWEPQNSTLYTQVLIYIDIMPDADVTFDINTSNASEKTIHYYVEALPGQNPQRTYQGTGYVEYKTLTAHYNFFTEAEDYIELSGYSKAGAEGNSSTVWGSGGSSEIWCYYTRNEYIINFINGAFYDGNNNKLSSELAPSVVPLLHESNPITYGSDIQSYQTYIPASEDAPTGFVFEGWYMDENCTQAYTFNTMPEKNITVFARWREIQYRVFLHPNAEHDLSLDWGSPNQSMSFRISYDGLVSCPTGRRVGFEFVGWFTDDETFNNVFNDQIIRLNEITVTTPYDKTVTMTDSINKWGEYIPPLVNKDITRNRFWITKKLDLYAQWRTVVEGAIGITVEYDGNGGSPVPEDLHLYKDQSYAVAGAAPSTIPLSATNTQQRFLHWSVQRWDGTTFVDGTETVLPGGQFIVELDEAKVVVFAWENPSDENDFVEIETPTPGIIPPDETHTKIKNADYTIRLRAVYGEIEESDAAYIIWYNNYAGAPSNVLRQDGKVNPTDPQDELLINEAVSIPTPAARPGFIFKGWYKRMWSSANVAPTVLTPMECEPNFLFYNNDDGKYYMEVEYVHEVTQVAADESDPYDFLYAVWEPEAPVFTLPDTVCYGFTMTLPTTSENNGIVGAWLPSSVASTTPGKTIYTFTASNGQCMSTQYRDSIVVLPHDGIVINGAADFCTGGNTTLSVTGSAEATYWWSTGATTSSITVDVPDTYSVTVTDNGCEREGSKAVIENPLPVLESITVPTGVSCPDTGPFHVSATVTSGTPPYTYTWSGAATSINAATTTISESAVPARCDTTYAVTLSVTDNKGCASNSRSASFMVKDDAAPVIGNASLDRTLTSSNCTFAVPDLTEEIRALASDNCTAAADLAITQSPAAGSTLTPSTSVTTQTVTVTVEDACGNTTSKNVTLTVPAAPTATINGDANVCYDGTLTLTATGTGTTPLQYTWDDASSTSGTTLELSHLTTSGSATVTVADNNGCTAVQTANYNVYGQLQGGTIQYEYRTCNSEDYVNWISSTTTASGGTNGVYFWETSTDRINWTTVSGLNTETYNTLPAVHHVYVRRAWQTDCGVAYSNEVYIANTGSVNLGTVEGVTSVGCCYGSEINYTMTASGVEIQSGSPYLYEWYISADGTNWTQIDTATHQSFTYYNPSFTEDHPVYFKYAIAIQGCDVFFSNEQVQFNPILLPEVAVSLATQTIDLGQTITPVNITYANGTLTIPTLTSGLSTTTQTTSPVEVSGRPTTAGTYNYTVTTTSTSTSNPDCGVAEATFTIIVNDTLEVEPLVGSDTICISTSEANNTLTIRENAGNVTEFSYTWSVGGGGTILSGQGTQEIEAQWSSSGYKTISLIIENRTTHAQSHVEKGIIVNMRPEIRIEDIAEVCPLSTFSITGTVLTAPAPNYTFAWSGLTVATPTTETSSSSASTTATATACGTSPTLRLEVTDGHGCKVSATRNVTVKTPALPTIATTLLLTNDLGCNPSSIPTPQVSDFTVTDECNSEAVVTLTSSADVVDDCTHTRMWTASYTNSCGETVSKSISYTWKEMTSPVISTSLVSGTKACNWDESDAPLQSDFTVTDGCNSSSVAMVAVSSYDESVSCQRSRTWTATYQNGCGMSATPVVITYTWPYDVVAPVISPIADQTATPVLNCTYEMPDLEAVTLAHTTDACSTPVFVSQSIASGTEYPQMGTQQTIPVTVKVRDDCGNEQTARVNVIIPPKMSMTASASPTVGCLGSTFELAVTPVNAIGVPVYTWMPAATLSSANTAVTTATPTVTGTVYYIVTVRDENGCSTEANLRLNVIDTVKIQCTNATQAICLGDPITDIVITTENGIVEEVTGLPEGVTYVENTISGTPTASGSHSYMITATSTSTPACETTTLTGTIQVSSDLTVTASGGNATCTNDNGTAVVSVSGGAEPFTFSYAYKYPAASHNSSVNLSTKTTATPEGLDTAVYVVTVTDVGGCSASAEFTVGLFNDFDISVSSTPNHICSGGSFVITPTAPIGTSYTWGLPTQSIEGGVSNTSAGADQTTIHGEDLVNNATSVVQLVYTVTPRYGICYANSSVVTVDVDVTAHPATTITVEDVTVCWNVNTIDLTATIENVTATTDTVSWKFLSDSVAHPNAVSSTDFTDSYTATVPTSPCNNISYPYVVYYGDEYGCRNQRSANVIVALADEITITGGTNASTIECVSDTVAPHLMSDVMPTVKDACNNDISDQWTLTRPTAPSSCEGTVSFVYTFRNCDNKTADWTYTYTIERTAAPAESGVPVSDASTVECLSEAVEPATLPVVRDACGDTLTAPTPVVTNTISGCRGTRTYTYTYTDCVGTPFVWTYTYTINPTTPPIVNATGIAASKTVTCLADATAPTVIPTALSHCEERLTGVLTLTEDAPASLTCEGTRTYTYTYTDCAGLTATWSFVYTIEAEPFADPADVNTTVSCISDVVAPHTLTGVMPTVTDHCGNTLSPTLPLPSTYTVGSYNGCSGTVSYVYNYEDCEGNSQDWTYTYNISMPIAPALSGVWPSNQSNINACYAGRPTFPTDDAIRALYTASCGNTLTVTSSDINVVDDDCNWSVTREYTITDGCTPVTNQITYSGGDQTAPTIGTGYATTVEALVSSCTYTYPDVTTSVKNVSTDNCTPSSSLTVTQSPAAGTSITLTAAEQTLPVKVYVSDFCGNKDSVTVNVTAPAALALTIDNSSSNCYGTDDGFINYTITGGEANYSLELTGTTAAAATHTSAGSYSFTNLADGTYSLTVSDGNGCEATATTSIQQIANTLTIKANDHTWPYDGNAHSDNGFTITLGSESHTSTSGTAVTLDNGDIVSGVTITGSITEVAENPVVNAIGTGIVVTRNSEDITCYYQIDVQNGALNITNSNALSLTCNNQSKTYDGEPLSYTAEPSVSNGTTVEYSTDGGAHWSTSAPSITTVGTQNVRTRATNPNYDTAECEYTLTINPAALTIKLDTNKTYDGLVFTSAYAATGAGYTVTGLVSGDEITAGTVTSTGKNVGNYVYNTSIAITMPFMTANGISNYNVTYDLKQSISKQNVVLTSADLSKVYDGTALVNGTTPLATESGWVSGEGVDYTFTGSQMSKGESPNSFSYTPHAGTLLSNYEIAKTEGTLTVDCRPITITAASVDYTYDGNTHTNSAFTLTGSGLVGGDVIVPVIEGSIQFPRQSPVTNEITSYNFTNGDADNYCVTLVNGLLTMDCTSKTIAITADNGTWTYDGTTHTKASYTLTIDGGEPIEVPASANGDYIFSNGDVLHVIISGEVKNVTTGTANVVASYTITHGTEDMTDCYNVSLTNGVLIVNCRHITLTSGSASKTYDGTALTEETVTLSGDGLATDETLNYSGFSSLTEINSIANTFTYNFVSPARASNYCVDVVNGTLTVTCKEVVITAQNATRTYNRNPLTQSGFTVSALEAGDTHTFTVTMTDASTITEVGTQPNVIATVDGVDVTGTQPVTIGNYCVSTEEGTLTITKSSAIYLTCPSGTEAEKVYDGEALSPLVYATGISSDPIQVEYSMDEGATWGTENPSITNAGTLNVQVRATNPNYDTATCNYVLTVTPSALVITINDTKVYDGAALVTSYAGTGVTVSGLIDGDALTAGEVTTPSANASTYNDNTGANITTDFATTNGIGNYNVSYNFTQTITPRNLTITVDTTKKYDGTPIVTNYGDHAVAATGLVTGDALSAGQVSFNNPAIGEYSCNGVCANPPVLSGFNTVNGIGNYNVTHNLRQVIEKNEKPITITSSSESIAYDGLLHKKEVYLVTYDGSNVASVDDNFHFKLPTGDTLTITPTFAGITQVSENMAENNTFDYVLQHATNYDGTPTTTIGTVEITPRDLTIKLDTTKMYDGTAFVSTYAATGAGYTVTGLQNGATITAGVVTSSAANAATYTNGGTPATAVSTAFTTSDGIANYNVTYDLKQVITPRDLTIKLDTTKVYDGSAFVSTFAATGAGYTVTGLQNGATITAGAVTSSAKDVATYIDSVATNYAEVTTAFTTSDGIANYNVTYDLKQVITPRDLTIKLDTTKMYDGTAFVSTYAATGAGYTVTGLQNGATITAGVVTSSAANAATYTNGGTPATAVSTAFTTSDGIANYNVTYDLKQVITPRELTIKLDTTKTYDGLVFVSTYAATGAGYTVTGLQNGATITAGVVTSSAKDVDTYEYTGTTAPGAGADMTITTAFTTSDGIANYNVTYDLKQVITLRELTIKLDTTKTYDGTAFVSTYAATGAGYTVTGLQNGATITAGAVTSSAANAATYTNGGTPATAVSTAFTTSDGIANYNVTYDLKQVITPRDLTIKLDTTKMYDGTAFVSTYAATGAGYTVTGLQNGATITAGVVTSSAKDAATYTNGGTPATAVSTAFTTSDGIANYNVTYDLKQVITLRELTIKLDTTKTYDGTAFVSTYAATGAGYTVTGLQNGATITAGAVTSSAANAATYTNGGTPATAVSTAFTTSDGIANYNVTYDLKQVITPRELTIKLDTTKVYDGSAFVSTFAATGAGYTVTGLQNGATITAGVVTSSAANAATYTNGGTPATAVSTAFTTSDGIANYNVTYDLKQVITPRDLTIKLDTTKMYDGTAFVSTYAATGAGYTVTGLQNGATITAGAVTSSAANTATYTNGGTPATAVSTAFTTSDGIANYNVTYDLKQVITPRDLTIKLDTTKTYDGTAFVSTYAATGAGYTVTGLQNGATITAGVVTSSAKDAATYTNGGTPATAVSTAFTTSDGIANYNVTYDLKQVITPRELTIKLDTTKTYDGLVFVSTYAATGAGYTVTGLQNGATITAGVVTSSAKDVDTYEYTGTTAPGAGADMTITTAFTTSDDISNYSVTYDFKQVITPRELTIKLDTTKVYDGSAFVSTFAATGAGYTVTGLQNGATITAGVVTSSAKDAATYTNGGTPATAVSTAFTTSDGIANYNVTYDLKQVITPRDLTLTSESATKYFDGTPLERPVVTVSGSGFVAGEVSNLRATGSITNIGSVTNTIAYDPQPGFNVDNYTITLNEGTLTVEGSLAPIFLSSADSIGVYDGNLHAKAKYVVLFEGMNVPSVVDDYHFKLPTGDTLTITSTCAGITNVGTINNTFTYTIQHEASYLGTRDTTIGVIRITPRPLDITADNLTKMYDGAEHTYAEGTSPFYTVEAESTGRGLLSGHSVSSITLAGAHTDAGTENIVPSAATIMNGSDNVTGNYAINYVNGTLTITPRTGVVVTIQEHGAEYDYDGTLKTVTGYTFSSNDSHYLESYITFTGDATASGTGVENALRIFPMQLYASDFSNNSPNFSNVQFTIADSALYIYPMLKATAVTTNVTCNGFDNGEVQISVTGGKQNAGKYMFAIDGGTGTWQTTPYTFTGLTPVAHTVVVTDSLGYTSELNFTITEPDALNAVITNPANTCPNQGNYTISVTVTGGTSDYHYVWSGDVTDADASSTTAAQIGTNDCGHTYSATVTVTDHFGCIVTQTSSFEVKDIEAPTFTAPADTTLCRETGGIINADIAITGDVTDEADNCSTGIEAVWRDLDTTGNDSENRIIRREWTLVDDCGNSTTKLQNITIRPSVLTAGNVSFTVRDTAVVLDYGVSDTLIGLERSWSNNMTGMGVRLDSAGIPYNHRYVPGTYMVRWYLIDDCGDTVTYLQHVEVSYPACGYLVYDADGYAYPTGQIGSNCWTLRNARSMNYWERNTEAVMPILPDPLQYPGTETAPWDTVYGKLYTYWAATGLTPSRATPPAQVRGICPLGWHIPDDDDFIDLMVNYEGPDLMSSAIGHWLEPGTDDYGFTLEPAGCYNPELDRYEYLHVKTVLWSYTPGATNIVHACEFGSACGTIEIILTTSAASYSVRCVHD